MPDFVEDWSYEEWRDRMPEPPDDGAPQGSHEEYLDASVAWINERVMVMAARYGHDTPEMRALWSEKLEPTKDQKGFAALILDIVKERPDQAEGVLLLGSVGNGKTRAVGRATHLLREAHMPTAYVKATQLIDELRDIAIDSTRELKLEDRRNALAIAPALVIDDIGAQRSTEFSREQLTALLDSRYSLAEQEPIITIVTTNLGHKELEAYLGERAYSRLMGLMTETFEFKGKDIRKAKK